MLFCLAKILKLVLESLVPPCCIGCNAVLFDTNTPLCTICRSNLPLTETTLHLQNGINVPLIDKSYPICAIFFNYPKGITLHFIHHLKYKNQAELGVFFAQLWLEKYPVYQWPEIDLIIPVPLHSKKRRKRGYNQLDFFGNELSKMISAHYCTDVLKQTRLELSQTKKNVRERFDSKKKSYQLAHPEKINGKSILLIDDVISSGATISSCVAQLKKGAPVSIKIAAIAYTPKKNQFS